jgi:two-component system response regulator HydG
LIFGESGTGKELVARAIHAKSERAKGPFFALNCAALPKDILENELFGHEKGAFTGSTNEKPGAFEMADGGTIFLDEVAEMPPDIQVKLLRAIESRTIRRLGGKKEIEVDIRILAATNRDVQKALADNDLREDLYYRLAVVELFLPPLRERIGDIKLLANEFLARFAEQNGKPMTGFDDEAWEWILSHNWQGNVRELKNAVERAVIMSRTDKIKAADIMPRHLRRGHEVNTAMTVPPGATLADTRRQLVLRAFASTNGDYARAASVVGMTPADVRAEIASLLNGRASEGQAASTANGVQRAAKPADSSAPAGKSAKAPARAAASSAKAKPKKR